MRISNSEIQTFKRCRRKWWFQYYLMLRPNYESEIGPASVGTRVHICLETYYDTLLKGLGEEAAQIAAYGKHNALIDYAYETNLVQNTKKFDSEAQLTAIMLQGYFEWLAETGADEGLEVVGAERTLSLDLPDVTILAKLDLLVRRVADNAYRFMDYKNVTELSTPLKTAHLNEQFLMYEWLLKRVEPDSRVDGGIFTFLRRVKRTGNAKPPFYARLEVRHNDRELDSFEKRLLGELRAILSLRLALDSDIDPLTVIFPTPTRDCHWDCPFFEICPMVDRQDGSATRMIELSMRQADPYERYDNE